MINKKKIFIISALLIGLLIPAAAAEIHKAAKDGDFETVKKLLEQDPKLLDKGNRLQQTPLLMASYGGHKEIVRFLIDKGADVNRRDAFGAVPLHMAVLGGQKEIVELLISKGADVNVKSKNGKIPLQMAFERDDPDIVSVFLKHGVRVDSGINQYDRTLLHEAVIMGKTKIVNFLVEKGAPIDARDNSGKTPLDLALICQHKKLAQLLMDKGAKPTETAALEVTYIANAGFLLSYGKHKILIDALFRTGFEKYSVPSKEILEDMVKAEPPFDDVSLLLVSFNQAAHFDTLLTEDYLLNNTRTLLLSSGQVGLDMELYGSQFEKIKHQVMAVTPALGSAALAAARGIKLKILRLNYAEGFQNLGFIINLGGKTLLYLGDAILRNNEDIIKKLGLNQEGIDVLFITYWDFLNAEARTIINQYIQPKHFAIMHIPFAETDKISKDIEKLKKEYPNVTIFKESLEKKVY